MSNPSEPREPNQRFVSEGCPDPTGLVAVSLAERHARLGQRGATIWLTGLSGSGKSSIACALERRLFDEGRLVFRIDGDRIRTGLSSDLGFSEADRQENNRRIAELVSIMNDAGVIAVVSMISPYKSSREMARGIVGSERFVEAWVSTPLEVCEQRDPKGLYRRARSGEIPNFTGISDPYEAPESPDLDLDTTKLSVEASVDKAIAVIAERLK